ncbi:MAG: hypothetical protein ACRER4_07950, partial [Steroidobacteraceae bacterium]
EEHAAVIVAPRANVFGTLPARIDGFTFTGAEFSGGLIVNGYANGLEISNNIISNNQGQAAGGIRVGHPTLLDGNNELVNAQNNNLSIHNNHVMENGSTFDHGGGIGIYNGAANYRVVSNNVCGNFAQGDGAGIAHYGRSPDGVISKNRILFNQSFDQTATGQGGTGGGILIAGHPQPVGAAVQLSGGTGSVQVNGNLIQGNQAGSGDGGGIALRFVNGQDVLASSGAASRPAWNKVDILNNMIVNNVAGLAGGAISLQDAVQVAIVNNTIANNDSAGTAAAAFGTNPNFSLPQPAGIAARAHSQALDGIAGVGRFSRPSVLENNIILGNRAQHWVAILPGPGPARSGLVVDGVWDLGSLGVDTLMNPQRNILTDDPSNMPFDANNPRVAVAGEDALLEAPYYNGDTGALPVGAFNPASFNTALLAATANDEGGNFVTVIHGPLSAVGDYHLETGSSAIDPDLAGGTNGVLSLFPVLLRDYDADQRPVDGTAGNGVTIRADLGADEAPAVTDNLAGPPQILSTPASLNAFVGELYTYQVIAVDPNGTAVSYLIVSCKRGGGINAPDCNPMPTISSTGLLSWTPQQSGGTNRITIRAYSPTDTAGNTADQLFNLNVRDPSAPPVAANDSYNVNR